MGESKEDVNEMPYEEIPEPDYARIVTENDEAMVNLFSEKQQRLLARSLNAGWKPGRPFMAFANVGLFYGMDLPPVVPDMFLSLDVVPPDNVWLKKHRSYFSWIYGKQPEVAVEIVSNTEGGEMDKKFDAYARIGIWYYLVFDPMKLVQENELRVYELIAGRFTPKIDFQLPSVGLQATLWEGRFEGRCATSWLRWRDSEGNLILLGEESAARERERADLLAARLKSMGIDPEEIFEG